MFERCFASLTYSAQYRSVSLPLWFPRVPKIFGKSSGGDPLHYMAKSSDRWQFAWNSWNPYVWMTQNNVKFIFVSRKELYNQHPRPQKLLAILLRVGTPLWTNMGGHLLFKKKTKQPWRVIRGQDASRPQSQARLTLTSWKCLVFKSTMHVARGFAPMPVCQHPPCIMQCYADLQTIALWYIVFVEIVMICLWCLMFWGDGFRFHKAAKEVLLLCVEGCQNLLKCFEMVALFAPVRLLWCKDRTFIAVCCFSGHTLSRRPWKAMAQQLNAVHFLEAPWAQAQVTEQSLLSMLVGARIDCP